MCNLQNLFCNSATVNTAANPDIACTPIKTDLNYDITYMECGRYKGNGEYQQHACQDFTTTCLKQPSKTTTALEALMGKMNLGAPPEWDHPGFMKISTCPGAGPAQH